MRRPQPQGALDLPSFSMILETENLAVTDMAGLKRSLESLARQTPSPVDAREVLIIDSGDVDPRLLGELRQDFPWLRVLAAGADIGYYGAKMKGARQATGDIVLYVDSDCIYNEGWIRSMLAPFACYDDIGILGGETAIDGSGPYALAIGLSFFFDGFSRRDELYVAPTYYFNNLAVRRDVILRHPIRSDLPLYRGHCVVHAHDLMRAGIRIWRQPRAQARHAPPEGLSNFIWRFLLIGRDNTVTRTLMSAPVYGAHRQRRGTRWRKLARRLGNVRRTRPAQLAWLPLALPIALSSLALVQIGDLVSRLRPDCLSTRFGQLQSEEER